MQQMSRREFVQLGAAGSGAAGLDALGWDLAPAIAVQQELRIRGAKEVHSLCPYCAVGCSIVAHTRQDADGRTHLLQIEGDPDSPINRGTLCSKGIGLKEFIINDQRLTRPLYRAPGAAEWTPISWDDAFERMVRLIKQSRDRGLEAEDAEGRRVNRLANVGLIGGCTDTNEINFLLSKFRFGLGILSYENQARL